MLEYITYEQLARDVLALDAKLPRDVDRFVGIPRSGMLPASMLALHRNVPLYTMHKSGMEMLRNGQRDTKPRSKGHTVVVDDSIYLGAAMHEARTAGGYGHIYAAVYGHPDTPPERQADVVARITAPRRLFAWNLFHCAAMADAMLDLDGVICHDPPMRDDTGEGNEYTDWLPHAVPFNVPSVPVHTICTNRLETHRAATERWLAAHGVQYGRLIMRPERTAKERAASHMPAAYKASMYWQSNCTLFVESCNYQADEISACSMFLDGFGRQHDGSLKPVIALDTGKVYQ